MVPNLLDRIEQTLIPSVLLEEKNTTRIVRPLVMMASVGFVFAVAYNVLWALIMPQRLDRLIYSLLTLIPTGVPLLLIRLRRVRLAHHILLGGTWVIITITVFTAGGTRAPLFGLYTLIVMTAAFLSGWRLAFNYAILTIVTGLAMVVLNQSGIGSEPFATPLSAWLTQTAITIVITAAAYFVVRHTDQALQNAQRALIEREEMEAALRISEERFRLISSVTSDYTFSTRFDVEGGLAPTLLTGAIETITGYTPQEYLAVGGWRATLHPDDRAADERAMETLRTNQPVVSEVRIFTKSGETRWVRVYAHPIWDAARGQLVGINGGVQDITERKQAEEAVRRSEAHLRALLDATSDVAFLMSADGKFLTLNTTSAKALGKSVEEMVGQNVWESLEPAMHGTRRQRLDAVIESRQPARWEDLVSSGWWDNSAYPVLSPEGSVEALAIYTRNITERKRLEAELQSYTNQLEQLVDERTTELRHAKEQLELILNNTTDALAFATPNGDIRVTNPAFVETFDKQAGHAIETILWTLTDEEQIALVSDALLKVIYGNEMVRFEVQVDSPTGQKKDIDLAFIPVRLVDDDTKQGILLSGRDITQLKDIDRLKAQFVADAVHDLATPIAGLSTRLYLLKNNPEKMADHVLALENQVKHLRNLLEDLRTLSQIDRRQIALHAVPCNVNESVKRVFDTYEPVAINKQQSLTLLVDPTLPDMRLDQRQIERVLVNLVSNAINYTPEHKDIRIETALEENAVVVRVTDQGIGISAKDLPHVFERFYRSSEARRVVVSGTGLGLAISKEIVEMHGGSVTVTSEPGQGSTFTMKLPLPT